MPLPRMTAALPLLLTVPATMLTPVLVTVLMPSLRIETVPLPMTVLIVAPV
jgi:hypothetical protein